MSSDSSTRVPFVLTGQQLIILRLIAQGSTNARIGVRIGLAENTVKSYVGRLFVRLGARDRAHAVFLGCKHGLIPMGGPDE